MLATVPLTHPVRSVTGAQALAEAIAHAAADDPTGPALDRIVRYLGGLSAFELLRFREGIDDIMKMLRPERSQRLARYLVRHADESSTAQYWRRYLLRAV